MKTITIQVPDDFKVPEGYEVKIVKKEEKKEPVIRTYSDLILYNKPIQGMYLTSSGVITSKRTLADLSNINIAASEKVAKSMLAMAMISQLMPYYGGEITEDEWNYANMLKYTIKNERGKIWTTHEYVIHDYLAFHTEEQRDNFQI